MKTNIGAFDGFFRLLLFLIAIVVAVMTDQWWWLIPGTMLFITAVSTWSPLYAFIGINKSKREQH